MELPHMRFTGYFQEGLASGGVPMVSSVLGWGEHSRVLEGVEDPNKGYGHFIPLHSRKREQWAPAETVPSPLLPPNIDCGFAPVNESDLVYRKTKFLRHTNKDMAGVTLAFSKQMSRFCWDHNSIAFQCMGRLLEPHCYLGDALLVGKIRHHIQRMTGLMKRLQTTPYQDCPFAHSSYFVRSFSYLTRGWLHDVPPEMLAELVNEGMANDWKNTQFQASLTGGALSWVAYPGTPYGCLIYPRGAAMNLLYFQQLLVDRSDLGVTLQGCPAVYELQQRIQQVSSAQHEQALVGVRSTFHLSSWRFSAQDPPKPLSVLRTRTPSTCISASPHMVAEFCVCTESGTLYLWDMDSGLQRVRQDADNLVFRDDSRWWWSDFTSHPRVLTFADRTGVHLVDVRVPNSDGRELFRIGQESSYQCGERVILPQCLRETNPAYCLVMTQFSLYVMDERFPLVPVAKWDHMLEGPPTYVSTISGETTDCFNKILLSTQHSQETLMVQYSGGGSSSFQLHLPAISLPRISESLDHLAPLLPHHHDTVLPRLQSPLAGLAAASPESTRDLLLVFQLTAVGDLFIQRLSQEAADAPGDITVQPPVSDSAPDDPADDASHQSAPENEAVSCSAGCSHLRPLSSSTCHSVIRRNSSFCRWLHEVYRTCTWRGAIPRSRHRIQKLFPSEERSENSRLREHLRKSMRGGTLVSTAAAPTSHRLEVIHTESWKEPLSERLTASWEGGLGLWWEDLLGTNKEMKIQVWREKRRIQKLERSRSWSTLSGSSNEREATSPWSGDSAPVLDSTADLLSVPSQSQDGAGDTSQVIAASCRSRSSSAVTAHKKRQILRGFLSSAVTDPTPLLTGSHSQAVSQPLFQSLSQSQTVLKSLSQLLSLPQSQALSQSCSQRSQVPSKRFRMGF
ncbi:TATA box-binding protein-associated factor, RNA polymerase I, subunit C-like [Hyla sarda]|uniref:TATA box-binding protein-associated factor, RNA polymerase I, subunit C-like n=1 Tax=Hyla sarda TaxID=327740 RepID=UPI0024C2D2ED|nr:TATA box-binding protein-associated factor, RNA polymerase I, subunit C-like [Hyla sarda]